MIKKFCGIVFGLCLCGCVGYTIFKTQHPMGVVKKAKIDPRFDFDEFITS